MGVTYSKLFSTLPDSTIWAEPNPTRICWITMLAMADQYGRVYSSIPGLSNRARITMEETEIALATFMAPDRYSRTKDNEGRRIAVLDGGGGWRLLNYAMFRALQDDEHQRERQAKNQRAYRARKNSTVIGNVTEPDNALPIVIARYPIAEAEAEAFRLQGEPAFACKENLVVKHTIRRFTSADVDAIYQAYPKKEEPHAAKKAIEAALKRIEGDTPAVELLAIVKEYALSPQGALSDRKLIKNPATWFNKGCYLESWDSWQQPRREF